MVSAEVEALVAAAVARMGGPLEERMDVKRLKDALGYLNQVKTKYKDSPEVYGQLLDLMNDVNQKYVTPTEAVQRLASLFRRQPWLIGGLNIFLPKGSYIVVRSLEDKDSRADASCGITVVLISPAGFETPSHLSVCAPADTATTQSPDYRLPYLAPLPDHPDTRLPFPDLDALLAFVTQRAEEVEESRRDPFEKLLILTKRRAEAAVAQKEQRRKERLARKEQQRAKDIEAFVAQFIGEVLNLAKLSHQEDHATRLREAKRLETFFENSCHLIEGFRQGSLPGYGPESEAEEGGALEKTTGCSMSRTPPASR